MNILLIVWTALILVYALIALWLLFKEVSKQKKKDSFKKRIIFHITTKESFKENMIKKDPYGTCCPIDFYCGDTLEKEGFVHCSTACQIIKIAEKFKEIPNLILLEIDREKVIYQIKYENSECNTVFYPHVYGPINRSAIINVHELVLDANGKMKLPDYPSKLI